MGPAEGKSESAQRAKGGGQEKHPWRMKNRKNNVRIQKVWCGAKY